MDMERAGLADARSFRCLPCFSWVSTGACPFGQRCSSIHDPRAIGAVSSWLPHTDVPIGNLPTTVNVDKLYHTQQVMDPVSVAPPRSPSFSNDLESSPSQDGGHCGGPDTSFQLQVRLQLHDVLASNYVFAPTHFMNGELCMIHAKYSARILSSSSTNGVEVRRLPKSLDLCGSCSPDRDDAPYGHEPRDGGGVLVVDVSFGAKGDKKVPPRILLFDPDMKAVRRCTLQSLKRYKRQSRQGKTASSPTPQSPVPGHELSSTLARQIGHAAEKSGLGYWILATNEPDWIEFHRDCLVYRLSCAKSTLSSLPLSNSFLEGCSRTAQSV